MTVSAGPSPSLFDRLTGRGRPLRTDQNVVVLHDVTMRYPNGKEALREVDLVVPEGDFVFLVGPSGAGKSTLMKLLIRDELATRGDVLVDGHDLARIPRRMVPRVRRKIGIVFQDFKLLPRKTVWENVAFALEVTGSPRRNDQAVRGPGAGARGAHRAGRPDPDAAVRRRAAADGDRPGARPRPAADHRGRAHRRTWTR